MIVSFLKMKSQNKNSNNIKLSEERESVPWRLFVFFGLFSFGVILLSSFYYNSQKKRIFLEQKNNLTAIASLKLAQIKTWREEMLGDAVSISADEPLIRDFHQFLSNENLRGLKAELKKWMTTLRVQHGYIDVAFVDTSFVLKISLYQSIDIADKVLQHELRVVGVNKKIMITDLDRSVSNDSTHIDLLIPLVFNQSSNPQMTGFLIIRLNPVKTLFPTINHWPTPSKSSETLLLRREGDSVLYLNDLRFKKNSNLTFRLPISNQNLLAAKAASGVEDYVEGIDYRDIPVIGYIIKVPEFGWYLIAKTDKEELRAPLKRQLLISVIISILLIFVNFLLFGIWIWNQRIIFYKRQLKTEDKIHELEERFSIAFRMSPVSITISRVSDNKFIDVNDAFLKDIEYSREEVIGHTPRELNLWVSEEERQWVVNEILENRNISGKVISYKTKAGKIKYGLASINVVSFHGQPCSLTTIINITENRKAEEKLKESERLFRKLFENMLNGFAYCKMLYEDGQLPDFIYLNVNEAFVTLTGLKDVEGKRASEAIPGIQTADPELMEKYSRVSSTGKPEVFEIYAESLRMWFFISVYSPQKGYFVAVFDVITGRKVIEEKLNHFASVVQSSDDAIIGKSIEGTIISWNRGAEKVYGYKAEEVIGKSILILVPDGYKDEVPEILKKLNYGQSIEHFETKHLRKDGSIIIMSLTISPIRDTTGSIIGISTIGRDISERLKTEEALRESEDKFKYIFEHSALGNSISMPSGSVHFNNSFCETLGYSEEELTHMKWQDFTHPDDFTITQNVVDSLTARKSDSIRFTKRYLRKNGATVWADVSTSLRYDNAGTPLYFMTTINDITELKLAEDVLRNDEKRLRDLIEALPQLFWTCRSDGPCDYLSRQWVEYTGIPESEQLGYGWLEQLHPDDRERVISEWTAKVKTEESFDIEFRIHRLDGEYHWFQTRAVPMRNADNKLIKWLGSNTDIDAIRKAEVQLINYNKDLAQSVIQRTEQLEAANKELEAFSYSVSHDLRAPLRSVHGFTKILREDYEQILDDEGKRICGIISSSASQMSELIDDLLSFSRIGRSSMNPVILDMNIMVDSIVSQLTTPENNHVQTRDLLKAYGDANLIRHIWNNLISNAIKYSSKKPVPEIVISSTMSDNMIIYSVKDNGVGFDMQYVNKLFGVFQRLHSENEFEGNGVGLAIVQRIVKKHGGRVWAEGEVGIGATFYFSLPANGA